MHRHINYEDNIFILNTKIRNICDLMLLEPEPSLFLDKTMEDIDFIGNCADILLSSLLENKQIIDWDDRIQNIHDAEDSFVRLLRRMESDEAAFDTKEFPQILDLINALTASSIQRMKKIKDNMREPNAQSGDQRMVSPEELALLVG
jgi:hypothetical protein